jgi:hypothetical protein
MPTRCTWAASAGLLWDMPQWAIPERLRYQETSLDGPPSLQHSRAGSYYGPGSIQL